MSSVAISHDGLDVSYDTSGAEWLLLQGCVDFQAKNLQFGPFVALTFARFANASCGGDCDDGPVEYELADPAFHQWIMLGVRGTVGL